MSVSKLGKQDTLAAKHCSASTIHTIDNIDDFKENSPFPNSCNKSQNNLENFQIEDYPQQEEVPHTSDYLMLMTKSYETTTIKPYNNECVENDNERRGSVPCEDVEVISTANSFEITSQPLSISLQTHRSSTSSSSSNSTAPFTTNLEIESNNAYHQSSEANVIAANLLRTQKNISPSLELQGIEANKTPSPKLDDTSPSFINKNRKLSKISSLSKFSSATEGAKCEEDTISKTSDTSGELVRGYTTLGEPGIYDTKSKNTSRLSERAKKKSWYNVLYPNYKSRAEDFKKLFKEVPNDERLIVDYSCALQRDILVQGRLYVSQNYVCFHANIFSWETYLSLKWKDVTSISKEKTALVIPNAISISTAKEKYFFATFAARDKAFLMLFRVWQNILMNKQLQPQEIWQFVHNCYGEELGLTTDDEDYIDPTTFTNDTETELDFISALDDPNTLGRSKTNKTSSSDSICIGQNQFFQNIGSYTAGGGGNSSTSSGSGIRKSKSKSYFFNSSKKTCSTTASASASGSDNKGSDTKVSNSKMKATSKDITVTSAKSDEIPTTLPTTSSKMTIDQNFEVTLNSTNSTASISSNKKDTRTLTTALTESKRKVSKKKDQREELLSKNKEQIPTDHSDSSGSESNNTAPFVATTECTSTHEGRQLLHTLLPINVDSLFNLLFSKSKFLIDLHASRNSTDLDLGEWSENSQGQKVRIVNVTVQVAASVGPKTARVTEEQVMRDCSKPSELYSIDITSTNAGIPYADSFCVLMHFCLVRTADDHTMFSVHGQIKYTKSIWAVVKGFIEKNTWAGLEDFYADLLQNLQNETRLLPAKGKGRRPRRGPRLTEDQGTQGKPDNVEITKPQSSHPQTTIGQAIGVVSHNKHTSLSVFLLVLIGFLIAFNVVLLIKLWRLEERVEYDLKVRSRLPNLGYVNELPSSSEDWINLMRQQEILHETELKKWHKVLQTAIELLKK